MRNNQLPERWLDKQFQKTRESLADLPEWIKKGLSMPDEGTQVFDGDLHKQYMKLRAEYEACKKVNQILLKEKTELEEENQRLRTAVTELETEIEGLLTSP